MDELLVNYLRVTSALEIEKADSGHPGVALGAAPIAYSIFKNAFFNPCAPYFVDRDRIVFSAGHASALVYACLHLFGFDVSKSDLQNFRRFGSKTPGHPEWGTTEGIDATTGPLGQGFGMAVGMAIAEQFLRSTFQKGGFSPINHHTFCFVGDGCLMEGVAQEAASLAGGLGLKKLIVLYDQNNITIEGGTDFSNTENVKQKFLAMNWNVVVVNDANNIQSLSRAIAKAKKSNKPTLVVAKSTIGFGSEWAGQAKVHGKPLSASQIEQLKYNLDYDFENYKIPQEAELFVQGLKNKNLKIYNQYFVNLEAYKKKYPKEYQAFTMLNKNFEVDFSEFASKSFETELDFRKFGHQVFQQIGKLVPNFVGGCADLAPSTMANFDDESRFGPQNHTGKNMCFGVREHAMGAISNGIALHGGLRNFCSTFLSFENYMTPAIRLSSLMNVPVLYYFTHDSIDVGEDGPTHQPVEQLATLRAMPNLNVFRPCGKNELWAAWQTYFSNSNPCAIVLPRQKIEEVPNSFDGAKMGGYEIKATKIFDITLVACGSEVELCQKASLILKNHNVKAKIVSMPCTQIFDAQAKEYRNRVVNQCKPVFCVEKSSDNVWHKYATKPEFVIGLNSFGMSGNASILDEHFGFTPQQIANTILQLLK